MTSESRVRSEKLRLEKVLGRRLRLSYSHSPRYRATLDRAGVKVGRSLDLDRFPRVPIIGPGELAAAESAEDGGHAKPTITVQLESATAEDCDSIVLDLDVYRSMVSLFAEYWRLMSVRARDKVLVCDFGGSPIALVASGSFCTLGKEGVAEALGCIAICNDGMPEFVRRSLHIIEAMSPSLVIVRADLVAPLANAMKSEGFEAAAHGLRRVVITADQDNATRVFGQAARFGVSARRLLREDRALFSMLECDKGEGFHILEAFFYPEVVGGDGEPLGEGESGRLVVTNLFWSRAPVIRYATSYFGRLSRRACGCGSKMPLFRPRWTSSSSAPQV